MSWPESIFYTTGIVGITLLGLAVIAYYTNSK